MMVSPRHLFRRHANRNHQDGPDSTTTTNTNSNNASSELPTTHPIGPGHGAASSSQTNNNNNNNQNNHDNDDDDEENELIVQLPNNSAANNNNSNTNNNANNGNGITEAIFPFPWDTHATALSNPNNNNNNNNDTTNNDNNHQTLRRLAIHKEILRIQRTNAIHFALLCLLPTSLLLIVISAIISEDSECSGDGLTVCERETRSFVNAFTTRCICEAVRMVVLVEDEDGGG